MREYKFRGKRIDNGEWVYGFLIQYENGWFICNFIGDAYQYEVDPSTVGQFTGFKDKNGKEIYEDDLVQVLDYASWEGLYKVVWDEESLMYVLVDAYGDKEKMCEFEHYLVRGDIHENPELFD